MKKSDKNRTNRKTAPQTQPHSVPLPEVGPLSSDGKVMSERGKLVIGQMLANLQNSGKRPPLAQEQNTPSPIPSTELLFSDGQPMTERDKRVFGRMLKNLRNPDNHPYLTDEERAKSKEAFKRLYPD